MQKNRHNWFDFMKPAKKPTTAARMKMPQKKTRKVTD